MLSMPANAEPACEAVEADEDGRLVERERASWLYAVVAAAEEEGEVLERSATSKSANAARPPRALLVNGCGGRGSGAGCGGVSCGGGGGGGGFGSLGEGGFGSGGEAGGAGWWCGEGEGEGEGAGDRASLGV